MRRKIESIGDWNQKHILSVVGPTGSGKTKTVLDFITKNHSTAPKDYLLVSVDSIAVYKLLDIGASKPTHHAQLILNWAGLNLWDPNYKANIKGKRMDSS